MIPTLAPTTVQANVLAPSSAVLHVPLPKLANLSDLKLDSADVTTRPTTCDPTRKLIPTHFKNFNQDLMLLQKYARSSLQMLADAVPPVLPVLTLEYQCHQKTTTFQIIFELLQNILDHLFSPPQRLYLAVCDWILQTVQKFLRTRVAK